MRRGCKNIVCPIAIPQHILLSRTDSIGDVVLTLPMAGVLRKTFPQLKISFLGQAYTRAVVERCAHIDAFYDWNDPHDRPPDEVDTVLHVFPRKEVSRWARQRGIATRIGTSHRPYHWLTCNRLVNLGRKKSDLHEAQLNLQLLRPLVGNPMVPLAQMPAYYGWRPGATLTSEHASLLSDHKFNLMLHPKSKGSAVEWPLHHYRQLAQLLPVDRFQIIISGTAEEGKGVHKECPALLSLPHVTHAFGRFSLSDFIDFIARADGMVAASTGPLHIAAASGIRALGLYSSHRPLHAGRWGPVGHWAEHLSASDGSEKFPTLARITPEEVSQRLLLWAH